MTGVAGMSYADVISIMSRRDAMAGFEEGGVKPGDFVKVNYFKPVYDGSPDEVGIILVGDELKLDFDAVSPVLEGVTPDWSYSEEFVAYAMKVFDIFNKEPRFMSNGKPSPLLVEENKTEDKQQDSDIVILIAQREEGT